VILLMLLASAKLGDVAAYFVGTFAGRHKMAPLTSPNKTWEGAAASLAASVIVALIFGLVGPYPAAWAAVFGLIAGVSGQLGDLAESRIKRDAGAKDSASLIPAFGGVLDTLDSLLLAGPACYAFFCASNYSGFLSGI
jgi:phosphatidate cytidylyltransferase